MLVNWQKHSIKHAKTKEIIRAFWMEHKERTATERQTTQSVRFSPADSLKVSEGKCASMHTLVSCHQ